MKLAKYIFAFYFCLALPASTFSEVHYDHSLAEGHESHICFERGVDYDSKTTPHSEESLWEHVFEAGCIETVTAHTLGCLVFSKIFQTDLQHTSNGVEYEITHFYEILISHYPSGSDRSRAPPLFN